MWRNRLFADAKHKKSATVVGDVMGGYHPHGDSSIYEALVRMAQGFAMRMPLVEGSGNFGSMDGDPAAAMRYTECRLDAISSELLNDLDQGTVHWHPNYDGTKSEPVVLPAKLPNLLINGATGIAVGMATNMAPHNLIEVVSAAVHLLEHPEATLDDLMEFVPGPDLPGGGIIVGLDGIRDAYASGRGTFRTRAKVSVESLGPRRTGLVVTELPYMVGAERVIEKIKDAVGSKKLTGIADVADLTDRNHGLRLVIGIKTGFDPNAVLEQLYRLTPLEDSFGINNVALVGGQPQTLGLVEMLRVYLDHRIQVVTRRSRFRLARKNERLHLVEGLLIAILDIDEVIQVIRTSDDGEQARTRLMDVFDLSQPQAEYILELRLRRLTKFSRIELESERDQLKAEIARLEELLGSDALLRAQVARELDAAAEAYGTPRRTLLLNGGPVQARSRSSAPADLQIADAPCRVFLSATGRMVRAELDDFGAVVAPVRRAKHDAIRSAVTTTTRRDVGAVTSAGWPSASRPSICRPATPCSWPARAPTQYPACPARARRGDRPRRRASRWDAQARRQGVAATELPPRQDRRGDHRVIRRPRRRRCRRVRRRRRAGVVTSDRAGCCDLTRPRRPNRAGRRGGLAASGRRAGRRVHRGRGHRTTPSGHDRGRGGGARGRRGRAPRSWRSPSSRPAGRAGGRARAAVPATRPSCGWPWSAPTRARRHRRRAIRRPRAERQATPRASALIAVGGSRAMGIR